jgi:hypothetical protein
MNAHMQDRGIENTRILKEWMFVFGSGKNTRNMMFERHRKQEKQKKRNQTMLQ